MNIPIWDSRKRESNLAKHGIDFADLSEFSTIPTWSSGSIPAETTAKFDDRRLVAARAMYCSSSTLGAMIRGG